MSDEHNDNSFDDDLLNKVIRMTRAEEAEELTRPSEAAIQAYLTGSPNEAEMNEVRSALVKSAAFRAEIVGMAKDLSALYDPETQAAFDRVQNPAASKPDVTPAPATETWGIGRILESIREFFSTPVGLAGLVAATAIVLVSVSVFRQEKDILPDLARASWSENSVMEAGLFVSNVTREPRSLNQPAVLYDSHRLAAEAEFQRLVEYVEGRYAFHSDYSPPGSSSDRDRIISIMMTDIDGEQLGDYTANLPTDIEAATADATAWLLTIPDRRLYTFKLSSGSIRVVWPDKGTAVGCLTVTYRAGDKFATAAAKKIDF